jgi:hypothetical protein
MVVFPLMEILSQLYSTCLPSFSSTSREILHPKYWTYTHVFPSLVTSPKLLLGTQNACPLRNMVLSSIQTLWWCLQSNSISSDFSRHLNLMSQVMSGPFSPALDYPLFTVCLNTDTFNSTPITVAFYYFFLKHGLTMYLRLA